MRTPPRTGELRLERHVSLETLEAATFAWNALADVCALQPFSTWPWVRAHVRHRLEPGETFSCHLAWRDEALVGVLPLLRLGRALRVPADFHTHDGEPLLATDGAEDALSQLLAHVVATEPPFTRLDLGGMRPGSRVPPSLAAAPGPVFLADDLTGRALRVAGPWDARRADLSPSFRRNLKKAHARALRDGATWLGLDGTVGDPAFVDAFVELEAGGWKGREGNSIRATPGSVSFYRELARGFADAGWLRFHRLELAGRLAAAQLGVRLGRRLVLLKIAYDESFSRLAPGNLLFDALMEQVSSAGRVDVVDCVTDMPWHDSWHMERYAYRAARFHPRRLSALLLGALPSWVRARARGVLHRGAVAPTPAPAPSVALPPPD